MEPQTKFDQVYPIDGYWLIEPNFADKAQQVLEKTDPTAGLGTERGEPSQRARYDKLDGGVARITMSGPMTKKETSASWMFGGCSTVMVRRALRAAVADAEVKSIALYIDTPGGQCAGLSDLADDVLRAKAQKPVVAYVSDLCASAGYYVASQCTKVFANRTALIGCIGTVGRVVDSSRMAEMMGLKVIVFSSGGIKGGGTPGTPVTEEYMAELQKVCDGYAKQFFEAVSKGRGMSMKSVREIGTGEVWFADQALDMGLIDGIATEDEIFEQMQRGVFSAKAAAAGKGPKHMAETQEKPGLMSRLASFLKGEGFDIEAASAGSNPETEAATTPQQPDPALLKQIAELEADSKAKDEVNAKAAGMLANAATETFVGGLLASGRIMPAEKEDVAKLHQDAMTADGGGSFEMSSDGKVVKGALTQRVEAAYSARPKLDMSQTQLASVPGATVLPNGDKTDFAKSWLGSTPTGQATLKRLQEAN